MHRSEKEALIGDLEGQWPSHKYPSEDAKRPLVHATLNSNSNQRVTPTGFEPWSTESWLLNVPTRPLWLAQVITGRCTENIFTKTWNGTFRARKVRHNKTVQITTHGHLVKYLDVVWGVANCNTTKNKLPCTRCQWFGCEISIKQNIAAASQIQKKLS